MTKPHCPAIQDGCSSPSVCISDGECHYTKSPLVGQPDPLAAASLPTSRPFSETVETRKAVDPAFRRACEEDDVEQRIIELNILLFSNPAHNLAGELYTAVAELIRLRAGSES